MTILQFDHVALHVNGQALFETLDFSVNAGEITCLVGPSGSGKSSLLAFACGFLPAAIVGHGHIRLGSQDLTCAPPVQRRLGLLFQDALLFPHLSVAGNVAFGLRPGGSRHERQQRVDDALAAVGLDGYGPRDPATLSGGQKARVALIRILLSEPHALLLDEPFGALDPKSRARVREQVFSLARERGLPTLLVTHDRDDVAAAGGRTIELVSQMPAGGD